MRVLRILSITALSVLFLSPCLFAQQPVLKWNPSNKKIERLNQKLSELNEGLNEGNATIVEKLRSSFPTEADSLIKRLYDVEALEGPLPKVVEVNEGLVSLEESTAFARGQEGTNEVVRDLEMGKPEIELLQSQTAFLENLSKSEIDMDAVGIKELVVDQKEVLNKYASVLEDYDQALSELSESLEAYILKNPEVAAFKNQFDALKLLEKDNPIDRSDNSNLQTKEVVQQTMSDYLGVEPSEVNQFVSKKIEEATAPMEKLKQRYDNLKDASDIQPEERNPLKTLPLKYRLEYSANLAINGNPSTALDALIGLGYRINPKMTIGFGASQRTGLGSGWDKIDISYQGWGYRIFYDYRFMKAFYFEAAFEEYKISNTALTENTPNQWKNGGLVGLGRQIKLGRNSTINMLLLYNLINRNNSQFNSPWVFRLGVNFNKSNR